MRRTDRQTTGLLFLFGASAIVCSIFALASCGARTELDAYTTVGVTDAGLDAIADADAAVQCQTGDFPLQRVTPAVVFTLDSSGSMNDTFSTTGESRWTVLTEALASALPAVDSSMQIGALEFPGPGATGRTCSAPSDLNISPATGNVNALVSLMKGLTPVGGTPTADSIDVAAAALLALREGSTARAIVLATDGAPNCNESLDPATCVCTQGTNCRREVDSCLDDTRTIARIADYAGQGLPTYVIGISDQSDAQFSSVLDAMAVAGGHPLTTGANKYYAATSAAELDDAVVAIRDQVGACSYLTSSVPSADGTITVTIDGQVVPYDPTGKNGWMWGDRANGEIVFLGATCDAVLGEAGGESFVAHVTCGVPDGGDAGDASDANVTTDANLSDADGDDAGNESD